jgi:hypothetical protein
LLAKKQKQKCQTPDFPKKTVKSKFFDQAANPCFQWRHRRKLNPNKELKQVKFKIPSQIQQGNLTIQKT